MKPATHYTKSGSINIAYQVFGSGPIDLVYVPGWVSNIDWMWACPELVDFLLELSKIARVILFDKRGTGLSDRVVELSTLEERMDDIRAVMDAVGSERAVLYGHSEGGSVSALFAAIYPERTIGLVSFGIFAKRRYSTDYPWAPTDDERQVVYDMIENSWGRGDMDLESLAPSKAGDNVFMDWLSNYFRSGASPSAAMVLTRMNTEVDIIDILGSIKVPALIMQRKNDIDVKIEEGKFIAKRIPKAKFVELNGSDHLFWVGDTEAILEEIKKFVKKIEPEQEYQEKLYTVVAARITCKDADSKENKKRLNDVVVQYRGNQIPYHKEDIYIAIFEGPSKAVHCGLDLVKILDNTDSRISVGIHIKEMPTNETHYITQEAESFIDRILSKAKIGEVLITQAVKSLLSGAGLSIEMVDSELLEEDAISLYMVKDDLSLNTKSDYNESQLRKDSFLENVLQSIERYFKDETFGVELLCDEVGISERQLQRKLKATTNKSPNQLITSYRLHRAKELLLDKEVNVSEIAYKTGFTNPSYFAKCFKREFGISPSDYLMK